jgi:hypothetical protein
MLTIPQRLVPREHVWGACRRPPDVGLRERDHGRRLVMDGRSAPAGAPWRSRDEATRRTWGQGCNEAGRPGRERASHAGRPT